VAILDEPTSGLDPQSTESFLELIEALKHDGVTVLLSSHMLDQVQRICDRFALFNHGKIALMGSVDDLAARVIGTTQRVSLHVDGGVDLHQALKRIEGVNTVVSPTRGHYLVDADRDVRSRVAQIALAQGAQVHTLSADSVSLDTIYRHYFSETGVAA
jgi:ABC-2 type transport system ATP-binding protein